MTVVQPSKWQRDGLFGGLVLLFVLALVRGLSGAQTRLNGHVIERLQLTNDLRGPGHAPLPVRQKCS